MIIVYETATELEAHMVLNMLNQADISGEISGAGLPGAVGELPAIDLVKILVREEDAQASRDIIGSWEAEQTFEPEPKRKGTSSSILPFLFGAAISAAIVLWLTLPSPFVEQIDQNGDGNFDLFSEWRGERLHRVNADRNFDGEIDSIAKYSTDQVESSKEDDDFDGRFESTTKYRNGAPYITETDRDGDSKIDFIVRYTHSIPRIYELRDNSGTILKKQMFSSTGALTEAFLDEDADGNFDLVIRYNEIGEEIERVPHE